MIEAKTLAVRIEYDERTRWRMNDVDFADVVRHLVNTAVSMHTDGARPLVLVNVHSNSEEIRRLVSFKAVLEKEGL